MVKGTLGKNILNLLENSVGENSTQPTIGLLNNLQDAGGSIDKDLDSF